MVIDYLYILLFTKKLHLTEAGLAQVRKMQKEININNSMTNKTGYAHP